MVVQVREVEYRVSGPSLYPEFGTQAEFVAIGHRESHSKLLILGLRRQFPGIPRRSRPERCRNEVCTPMQTHFKTCRIPPLFDQNAFLDPVSMSRFSTRNEPQLGTPAGSERLLIPSASPDWPLMRIRSLQQGFSMFFVGLLILVWELAVVGRK